MPDEEMWILFISEKFGVEMTSSQHEYWEGDWHATDHTGAGGPICGPQAVYGSGWL